MTQAESVRLPVKLDALAAVRCVAELKKAGAAQHISVNASKLEVPEPFAMLMLTCAVRSLRESGITFDLLNAQQRCYAAHMGLYAEFDPAYELSEATVRESDSYLAIKTIRRTALDTEAAANGTPYAEDIIDDLSLRFARLLAQEQSSSIVEALSYCICEIMRNSYEHSNAEEFLMCAQYRPSANRVDLSFGDRGQGVLKTLRRNRRVVIDTEMDAVKIALMPGISGADRAMRSDDNPWANSGYGLFMTHRICREGGSFILCSGDAFLRLAEGHKMERQITPVGTLVSMTIILDQLRALDKRRLGEFAAEGAKIARNLRGANVTASAASTNLRSSEVRP